MNPSPSQSQFGLGLFEIGDCASCLYSYFCTRCALAESRFHLDQSSCCFNMLCLPVAPYRWMVRSTYGIGDIDNWFEDCCLSIFCPCCVVNQLYQTTKARGNVSQDGGQIFNQRQIPNHPQTNHCVNCLCAFFCTPCTIGSLLHDAVGMPWCLGCCCMNFFVARNVLRYQFRYKTATNDDCLEECCIPFLVVNCGHVFTATCVPCAQPIIYGIYIALVMHMQSAVEAEKNHESPPGPGYLVGYQPVLPAPVVVGVVPSGTNIISEPPIVYGRVQAQHQANAMWGSRSAVANAQYLRLHQNDDPVGVEMQSPSAPPLSIAQPLHDEHNTKGDP